MEQFLQGNAPLWHLLNEETLFISWRRSDIKDVNDWDHGIWDVQKIFNVVQKSRIIDHIDRNSKIRTRNVQLHQGHRFHDRRLYDFVSKDDQSKANNIGSKSGKF